jgi:hypothetical protein
MNNIERMNLNDGLENFVILFLSGKSVALLYKGVKRKKYY